MTSSLGTFTCTENEEGEEWTPGHGKDATETPTLEQDTQGCLLPSSCSEMKVGSLHAMLLLNRALG